MKEVIFIHIGQAGVALGRALSRTFCLEHSISNNGSLEGNEFENTDIRDHGSIFSETSDGRFIPTSLFVDTDPMTISEIRKGPYRSLYHRDNLISGKEGCADNSFMGYYTIGNDLLPIVLERIRKVVEGLDLHGFIVTHSVGGGTGSGMVARLLGELSAKYKATKVGFVVYPSPNISGSVVEHYNTVLSCPGIQEHNDITFLFDNEKLYRICEEKCGNPSVSYEHNNQLIAQESSFMASANPRQEGSNFLSCCLNFQGDVHPSEVVTSFRSNKPDLSFERYIPTGLKIGISKDQPFTVCNDSENGLKRVPRAGCLMANNTCVVDILNHVAKKFDRLYSFRSCVHSYVQRVGYSEAEFGEARDEFETIIDNYKSLSKKK